MKKSLGTIVSIMVVAILAGTFIMAKSSIAEEKGRDGRFIAYDDGTVLDTKTKLMWATKDNGSDIRWQDAKSHCENYRGGGYTNWRMPTLDELEGLYDESKHRPAACYGRSNIHVVTELIDITCFSPWASETSQDEAAIFDFGPGIRSAFASRFTRYCRALPVRYTK
jgi:hypothetical protein